MPYPRLTAAARQGDEPAIAALIQAALPPGSHSIVRRQDQALHIILRYSGTLNQAQTVHCINHVLQTLQLNLQHIQIDAYARHASTPIWREVLTREVLARTAHRHQPRSQQQRGNWQIPDWLAEKPNLHTYRRVLAAHFDLTRLLLILPFALYGCICAKHYNVADFLAGNIRIIQFLHGVNLIFHEAGHVLFMFFGQFIAILGGSLNQILIPAIISGYFLYQRQAYSGAITLCWVGENFWDVSIYAKDGRDMALPLLGGDGTIHDWNWILSQLGWLPYTELVGSLIYAIGTLIYISAIGLAIYFSRQPADDRLNHIS
jgi:hypothetical protein